LQAAIGITIADLSMSLDNVLLVASIARDNPALLCIVLTFSVLFMGFAANYVAKLIERYHWINYIGLAVILWVACSMIFEGFMGGEHVMGLRQVLGLGSAAGMRPALIPSGPVTAFFEILFIDIVLAGDNAIVVGALAAGLPAEQRKKVIMVGVVAALVLRIAFALVVTQLLQIVGLVLAGGLLLLWVAWRMYRELRQ